MDITKVKGRHVPDHQNDYCMYEYLNWWGQRNVDMDLLEKNLMYDRRTRTLLNTRISTGGGE